MRRISVVGTSGSGKTSLALAISGALGIPRLELDAVHWHRPGWTSLEREPFRAAVDRFTAGDAWVVDGNYSGTVQDVVWGRADTVVWLDPPRAVVMWQVIGRTLARIVRRTELWNGNRERWRSLATLDPRESIIAWAWTRHRPNRERYTARLTDPAWAHLRFVRLRSRGEVGSFLGSLG
jgi:adenylate kinase family enzyme